MQYLNLFIHPIRDVIIFPYQTIQVDDLQFFDSSTKYIGIITLTNESTPQVEKIQGLTKYGTLVQVKERVEEGKLNSYYVQSFARFKIISFCQTMPFILANVEIMPEDNEQSQEMIEVMSNFKETIKIYMENFARYPSALLKQQINEESNLNKLFYQVAQRIQIPLNQKLKLLQLDNSVERITSLILIIQNKIDAQSININMEQKLRQELIHEMQNVSVSPRIPQIQQTDYQQQYVNSLPWGQLTPENESIENCKELLELKHFGQCEIKSRILQLLAVKQLTKQSGSIICLHGPPGVGKTSLGEAIAESIGRPFQRVALGGVSDESQIRGHRKTYVGAHAGMIIEAIRKAKCINPVILLDEIDKVNQQTVGAALLEVLDPEQNKIFIDNFVNKEFDLSKILFIATANYIEMIQPALKDRLELIELSAYTIEEKIQIAKQHLIPKQQKKCCISGDIQICDTTLQKLIINYTKEGGVRELERMIASLFRRIALQQAQKIIQPIYRIDFNLIKNLFGEGRYQSELVQMKIGMCKAFGNDGVNIIEIAISQGNGEIDYLCRNDFQIEQGIIAISYLRNNFKHIQLQQFNIFIQNNECLGVGILIALISKFMNKKVHQNIILAGELTLSGKIAKQDNVRNILIQSNYDSKIILPLENKIDLKNLESNIQEKIIYVENIEEIFNIVYVDGFHYQHYANL